MRLELRLPQVKPDEICPPTVCHYPNCGGEQLQLHQVVAKPVRDTVFQQVFGHRYRCLRCGRTFRVYPTGVNQAPTSLRVKGLGVLLYLWG
jgi:hypothetical protein